MTPQLYSLLFSTRTFLKRYHPIIFFTLVGLLLAGAVFSLYQILSISAADASSTSSQSTSFDQKTVDKIKQLQISSDSDATKLALPSPRANPFAEK